MSILRLFLTQHHRCVGTFRTEPNDLGYWWTIFTDEVLINSALANPGATRLMPPKETAGIPLTGVAKPGTFVGIELGGTWHTGFRSMVLALGSWLLA